MEDPLLPAPQKCTAGWGVETDLMKREVIEMKQQRACPTSCGCLGLHG